ncbi:MAG: hypothetical protein ACUZ8O_00715 [Candidatus Anammoxibacter sp.]
MQKAVLKEIKIKLPGNVVDSTSNKEIINLLTDKALNKSEYYQSKCKGMEEKYGKTFDDFKGMVENSEKENFTEWDDLIVWEGYELGFKEWKNKYEGLKYCME